MLSIGTNKRSQFCILSWSKRKKLFFPMGSPKDRDGQAERNPLYPSPGVHQKQVLSELANRWKDSLTHTYWCQKCLPCRSALKVACIEKENWKHIQKNEIIFFVSLQYTKKPCQENLEGGSVGFCLVFKHKQNVRSHSPWKAPWQW